MIPPKSNRTKTIRYSKRLYRERNCIERVLGHLKINRAIATRYDQLAESFLGMLFIASARYWIKFVHAARIVHAADDYLPSGVQELNIAVYSKVTFPDRAANWQ